MLELEFILCMLTHCVKHMLFRDCVQRLMHLIFCWEQNCVCVDYKESGSRYVTCARTE
jgi:hypothetical protein